jgi:uncharacterized damage-inducible protein DinB
VTVNDLHALFEYGYWANRKLFAALSQLTAEQFTQPVLGSYGSVRNTLVHMLSAEWGWLDRCGGLARGPSLVPTDFPTAESLVERWRTVEGSMREFLSNLRDQDLDRLVEFSFGGGPTHCMPVGHLLQHAANHGVHHRGQVALLLRGLGVAPGNFDLLYYPEEKPFSASSAPLR